MKIHGAMVLTNLRHDQKPTIEHDWEWHFLILSLPIDGTTMSLLLLLILIFKKEIPVPRPTEGKRSSAALQALAANEIACMNC